MVTVSKEKKEQLKELLRNFQLSLRSHGSLSFYENLKEHLDYMQDVKFFVVDTLTPYLFEFENPPDRNLVCESVEFKMPVLKEKPITLFRFPDKYLELPPRSRIYNHPDQRVIYVLHKPIWQGLSLDFKLSFPIKDFEFN